MKKFAAITASTPCVILLAFIAYVAPSIAAARPLQKGGCPSPPVAVCKLSGAASIGVPGKLLAGQAANTVLITTTLSCVLQPDGVSTPCPYYIVANISINNDDSWEPLSGQYWVCDNYSLECGATNTVNSLSIDLSDLPTMFQYQVEWAVAAGTCANSLPGPPINNGQITFWL